MSTKPRFLYEIGQPIPGTPYVVRAHLGTDSLGTVYDVVEQSQDRALALKLVHPELLEGTPLRDRLRELAVQLSGLAHENIVQLVGVGEAGMNPGIPYLVTERLSGHTLARVLRRLRAKTRLLPLSRAFTVMAGLLSALDYAHSRGVAHGGVKPENVFLHERQDGHIRVKLIDFGTDRLLEDVRRAREAADDSIRSGNARALRTSAGPAGDIYASGLVLYELLSLHTPAEEPGPKTVSSWRAVPPGLDDLLTRMLDDRPDRRPDAADVLTALDAIRQELVRSCSLKQYDEMGPSDASTRLPESEAKVTPTSTPTGGGAPLDDGWDLRLGADDSPSTAKASEGDAPGERNSTAPAAPAPAMVDAGTAPPKRKRWWVSPEANQHIPDWIEAALAARQRTTLRFKRFGASLGLGTVLAAMVLVPSYRAWWPSGPALAATAGTVSALSAAHTRAALPGVQEASAASSAAVQAVRAAASPSAGTTSGSGSSATVGTKWVLVSDDAPVPANAVKKRDREGPTRPQKSSKSDDPPIMGQNVVESP